MIIHYCICCGKIHDKPKKYYDKEAKKEVFDHVCREMINEDEHCDGELRMISLSKRDILGMYLNK